MAFCAHVETGNSPSAQSTTRVNPSSSLIDVACPRAWSCCCASSGELALGLAVQVAIEDSWLMSGQQRSDRPPVPVIVPEDLSVLICTNFAFRSFPDEWPARHGKKLLPDGARHKTRQMNRRQLRVGLTAEK